MSRVVMVDQERITRAFFDTLSPFSQGYASYFQAAWPGSEIPEECPYETGSEPAKQWAAGQNQAVIAAIDAQE